MSTHKKNKKKTSHRTTANITSGLHGGQMQMFVCSLSVNLASDLVKLYSNNDSLLLKQLI